MRRSVIGVVLGVVLALGGLAGCGRDEPPEPQYTPDAAHTVTGTPEILGEVAVGNTLTPGYGTLVFPPGVTIVDTETVVAAEFSPPLVPFELFFARWEWLIEGADIGGYGGTNLLVTDDLVGATIGLCIDIVASREHGYLFDNGNRASCTEPVVVPDSNADGPASQ
jgi:hypothetical protein